MEIQNNDPNPKPPNRANLMILLAIGLAILIYLAQKFGCGPVQTEEKIEWIDR